MVEAVIVAAAILATGGGAVWQATRLADRHHRTLAHGITDLVAQLGAMSAGQYDDAARLRTVLQMHLPELVLAVQAQEQWTALSEALEAEMASIRTRMDDHQQQWFNLSTRVQVSTGHKALRIP